MIKLDMYAGGIYSGKTFQVVEQALKEALKDNRNVLVITEDRIIDLMASFFTRYEVELDQVPDIKQVNGHVRDMNDKTHAQVRDLLGAGSILVIDDNTITDDEARAFLHQNMDVLDRVYLVVPQSSMDEHLERVRFPTKFSEDQFDVVKFVCYRTLVEGISNFSVKEIP